MRNKNLNKAKEEKNDEFYTQLSDIEKELQHYDFTGKVIYCNCDTEGSNFVKYFEAHTGIKKLLYSGMPNTDFRSLESIEMLKQADIVVTNPPFSLFREYVEQLVHYDKKFLIMGSINAIKYKETFKLINGSKIWLGINNGSKKYLTPSGEFKSVCTYWFTNLEHNKRNEELILYKKYTPEEYPKYDNYDAINVDKVKEIPMDYKGVMGVPITFIDKFNPNQFEIIGLGISNSGIDVGVKPYKLEHKKYRKEVQKRGAVDGDLYMIINGEVSVPYARILIRNKQL